MFKNNSILLLILAIMLFIPAQFSLANDQCAKGDTNDDCVLGLEDAIHILQVLSNFNYGIKVEQIGRYKTGAKFDDGGTEITSYCPTSKRLYTTNGADKKVDIIDITDPKNPQKVMSIDPSEKWNDFGGLNSVAVKNGIVAIAAEHNDGDKSGMLMLYDTNGVFKTNIEVGILPDMVTFTPNGEKIIVANEGEPFVDSNDKIRDPEGSVSIITVNNDNLSNSSHQKIRFEGLSGNTATCLRTALQSSQIEAIHQDDKEQYRDFEPEYITISDDSTTAYVSLQENNGIAVIDLVNATLKSINGLGYKDHSIEGNGLDAKKDGTGLIETINVRSLYMPDTVTSFRGNDGNTYVLTANEGDSRELEDNQDNLLYADCSADTDTNTISDVNVSNINTSDFPKLSFLIDQGLTDTLTYNHLYLIGARSFSIWNGNDFSAPVFDSGDDFEKNMLKHFPEFFNAADDDLKIDSRSPKSGPEPEALAVGKIGEKVLAFIGLEKFGGIMIYDVTVPAKSKFLKYITNRNFEVNPDDLKEDDNLDPTSAGDLGPEGMLFISADKSPNGKNLLISSNEVSGTITIYDIDY